MARTVAPKRRTTDEKNALRLLALIEKQKAVIASARDEMRELVDELAGLALGSVEDGLDDIEAGIDRISEYL